MVGIDLPIKCSGFLMKKELEYFSKVLEEPKRPLTAIIGGAKVSDKILLIKNFLDKVDNIIIGGAMAFTFLKKQHNMKIGKSLFDEKGSHVIEEITNLSKEKNVKMLLPIDFVVAEDKTATAQTSIVTLEEGISDNLTGFDIGPKSAKLFEETILKSQTIIWNGPMGVFEVDQFGKGTKSVLDALVRASKEFNAITVVGGGDSASACLKYNVENQLSHISTGGGASMELLEGKELPGVIALSDQK